MPTWRGSRFTSPLLGDNDAGGGIYENVGGSSVLRSPYKTWLETFDSTLLAGDLTLSGATVTDIASATSPDEIVALNGAANYLIINPGTSVDDGTEIQFDISANGTAANDVRPLKILGPITSTTTLMDGKEIFFQTRIGIQTDATLGAGMDGHIMIGWITKDTSLMAPTTGVPTVVAGGGFGFHINGDPGGTSAGATAYITPFSTEDGITADPTRNTGVVVPDVIADLTRVGVASQYYWYTLGAKMRVVDADALTGVTDFYINGRLVDSIADSICMDSTEVFQFTIGVHNGPVDTIDLAVEYIFTGITRAGLTYPYDTDADVQSF